MKHKQRAATTASTVHLARDLRKNQTDSESILWNQIRGRKLGGLKFRRQHPIGPYVLDFFCLEANLGIELDGSVHQSEEQTLKDQQRTLWLEQNHIRVIRFTNSEVEHHLGDVLQKILKAAQSQT